MPAARSSEGTGHSCSSATPNLPDHQTRAIIDKLEAFRPRRALGFSEVVERADEIERPWPQIAAI